MTKRGLGRGLEALFPGADAAGGEPLLMLRPDEIEANPYQPRAALDEQALEELAQSVKQHGVLQPVVVRRRGDRYQLVTGERRWRAAARAGLGAVPAIMRDLPDEQMLQVALVENLQREDINPMEAARAYQRLSDEFGLSQAQIAEALGKSRVAIANCVRLLQLPKEVQEAIGGGRITEGHGRALLGLVGREAELARAWRRVEKDNLSVRETERLVREALSGSRRPLRQRPSAPTPPDPHLAEAEEEMRRALGMKVEVRPERSGSGGHVEITYVSAEELHTLVEAIRLAGHIARAQQMR